jgi:transcriptional regulator with XRE-family HTH domain
LIVITLSLAIVLAEALLRKARRDAGLTQRQLADRTGVAQPTIARIERGIADPRARTLERLLRACGYELKLEHRAGAGVDRSQFHALLRLRPVERLKLLRDDAAGLERLDRAITR